MPELNDPAPPAGFIARLKTLLNLPADTAAALGGKANSASLGAKANAADVYTKAEANALVASASGTPADVVLSRGNVNAVRPDLPSVTFKGHVPPASMRARFDVLQTLPAGVPVLGGTAPGALTVTVGTTDATLGLPTVAVETWITGQSATTTTLAVTTPQAVQTLAVPSSLFPAGSGAREYNVRVRGIPADVAGTGGVLETGLSLASEWSPATTFTVAALADTTPPVWSAIPAVTGTPGAPNVVYNLATYLTDDSGATPAVALVGSPAGVTLVGLTLTVSRASAVTDTITLRATDGSGNTADTTVARSVVAVTTVAPVDFRFAETAGDFANSGSLGGAMVASAGIDYSGDGINIPDEGGMVFGGTTLNSALGMLLRGDPSAIYVRMTRTGGAFFALGFEGQLGLGQGYNADFTRAQAYTGTHSGDNSVAQADGEMVEFFGRIAPLEGGGRQVQHYQRRNGGAWVGVPNPADGLGALGDVGAALPDGGFYLGRGAGSEFGARRVHRLCAWGAAPGGGDVTLQNLSDWGVQL